MEINKIFMKKQKSSSRRNRPLAFKKRARIEHPKKNLGDRQQVSCGLWMHLGEWIEANLV